MGKGKHIIFTFFLLIVSISTISQIPYETSKALFIFKFAENIEHENYKNIKKYKICFLGNDNETYQELKKVIGTKKIHGKTVELSFINNLDEISDVQLLYIDRTWSEKIGEVWFRIKNKSILLVSEECSDAKYIMLNIYFDNLKNKTSFEVNQENLITEDFTFDPEILLNGGSAIDIKELCRDMQLQLEDEEQKISEYKKQIMQYVQVIDKQKTELNILHTQTERLEENINVLLNKINLSEGKLNYLMDSVSIKRIILKSKLSQIREQEIKLEDNKVELIRKEEQIAIWTVELDKKMTEKNKLQKIIDEQKKTLLNQATKINKKNRQLIFSLAFALMFIVIAFSIFWALRIKQKANKKQIHVNKQLAAQKAVLIKTLTELKATQNQLIHSEKMASLGILTAGIAHEINNPINYINSGLEGLKTISSQMVSVISENQNMSDEINSLTTGIQVLTQNIQKGVSRTTEIVKSLSAFSRIDDDELTLTDIHENINSTIILLHSQFKNRIKIIKNYSKIPKINSYSSKLNQVFMNILSNAIQAIKDKGTITITTSYIEKSDSVQNNYIKISIKDTGEGISKKNQDKIFQPFFTTKELGKGTGIGLSITYGIIEQHKGRIEFTSVPKKGTEFDIYLPTKTNIILS